MSEVIKNAIIDRVQIDDGDRDLLTAWIFLDYGDSGHQGFGGFTLYLGGDYKHHVEAIKYNFAGHFIFRCMKIAGVSDWGKMVGKAVRVKLDREGFSGRILAIGHITKNDWFNPEKDFNEIKSLTM